METKSRTKTKKPRANITINKEISEQKNWEQNKNGHSHGGPSNISSPEKAM